jgi:subtilisin family serine protease
MRSIALSSLTLVAVLALPGVALAAEGQAHEYVVLYERGAPAVEARQAVQAAGGTIVEENRAIGVATVRATDAAFAERAAQQAALVGAARNEAIGHAPADRVKRDAVEQEAGKVRAAVRAAASSGPEPLSSLQWNNRMVGATSDGSYAVQRGRKAVRVGIIDTGIDGSHPDIAPNFGRDLSRNFTTDDPLVDGPCAEDPDGSCEDPNDVDEDGHGTHVASTIGSPLNGLGIGGVAPGVSLVNLRAGQDSGYFFLGPTLDALTYAGDRGIDVVNMSFFVDPWLFNCAANPADSPAEQREQRLIVAATQRAVDYARDHGVTVVSAMGNGNSDLGRPTIDVTSPDYPPGAERERTIDNSCLTVPTETEGVISVTAVGPSGRKAYYSDYGIEQADVAAPGGDRREFFGTERYDAPDTRILAAYPKSVGLVEDRDEDGTPDIDPQTGEPTTPLVVRQGDAYYQWIQGTSMASPHAAAVAALIVAEYGRRDRAHLGLTLDPERVERVLRRTATDTPCPEPRTFTYPDPELTPDFTAVCEGTPDLNGFYGDGIVNALAAVGGGSSD